MTNKYGLVSLDIDETIVVGAGFETSARFNRVVAALERGGVRVCLNTGRNAAYAAPVARNAGITSLCAALEGLSVFDPVTGAVVYENKIGYERVSAIVAAAAKTGVFIETTDSDMYYRWLNNSPSFDYDAGQSRGIAESGKALLEYVGGAGELLSKSTDALCVTIGGDRAALTAATAALADCRGLLFRGSLWDNYVVISAKACDDSSRVGKAAALNRLCGYYGLKTSQSVAMGDFINDAGMLAHAGLSVAMGNSHNLIKALADYIAEDAADDGAAKALERVFGIRLITRRKR